MAEDGRYVARIEDTLAVTERRDAEPWEALHWAIVDHFRANENLSARSIIAAMVLLQFEFQPTHLDRDDDEREMHELNNALRAAAMTYLERECGCMKDWMSLIASQKRADEDLDSMFALGLERSRMPKCWNGVQSASVHSRHSGSFIVLRKEGASFRGPFSWGSRLDAQ